MKYFLPRRPFFLSLIIVGLFFIPVVYVRAASLDSIETLLSSLRIRVAELTRLVFQFSAQKQKAQVFDSTSGLIAHYTFDEASGFSATDSSGGNAASLQGGTTWIKGKIGSGAVQFSSAQNSVASVPAAPVLNNLGPVSLSLWAKPTSLVAGAPFISKATNSGGGQGWSFGLHNGTVSSLNFTVYGFTVSDLTVTTVSGTVVVDEWAHYVVTWDGTNQSSGVKVYKNGALLSTVISQNGGSSSAQSDVSRDLKFARESGYGSNYFNGALDDVRIYNRVLAESDVQGLYGMIHTPSGPPSGDTSAPSVPFSVSALLGSPSEATIAWSASSDDVGVVGYRVYRNATLLTSVTGTTFFDTALSSNTTYTYTVSAYDAAGNVSLPSVAAVVTTPLPVTPTYSLTVSRSGTGTGSVIGSGITCGTDCSESLVGGSSVLLQANPGSGSSFGGWSGACTGTGSCSFLMNSNTTVQALFSGSVSSSLTAPVNLRAHETHQDASLYGFEFRWDDPSKGLMDGFLVEKSTDGVMYEFVATTPYNDTHYTITVPNGTTNWLRIKAFKGGVYSEPTAAMKFTTIIAPLYYKVAATESGKVLLTWRDISTDETGFMIERSTNGKDFQVIAKKPTADFLTQSYYPDKIFTDDNAGAGLLLGTTYHYRLTAYNALGVSPYPEVFAVAPGMVPAAPLATLTLTKDTTNGVTPNTVLIQVTDNSNNEQGFVAERSTDGVTWTLAGTVSAAAGEKWMYDRGITPGVTYQYRIAAYNQTGRSSYVMKTISIPAVPPVGTRLWYVSKGALGSPTGASWTNAWRSLNEINWVAIKPGDTLYLDGGTYNEVLYVYSSGTVSQPVTIRPGSASPSPSGHSSRVVVNGIQIRAKNVVVDGGLQPSFVPVRAYDIVPNINMEVTNCPNSCVFSSDAEGITVRFLNVHHPAVLGANGISLVGNNADRLTIYGNHIHDITQDGIGYQTGVGAGFDSIKVSFNLIERTNDDGIEAGGHATINNNVISGNGVAGIGHPDGMQLKGDYIKIYNNSIYNRSRSSYVISIETYGPTSGHWHIFNNQLYFSTLAGGKAATASEGIFLGARSQKGNIVSFQTEQVWDDIIIANNTFVNLQNSSVIVFGTRVEEVAKVRILQLLIANNLSYNNTGTSGSTISLKGDAASSVVYDNPSSLVFKNNVVAGSNTNVTYKGVTYPTVEALDAAVGFQNNSSNPPIFVSYEGADFRPANSDTVVKNRGADLSSFFAFDYANTPRPVGTSWDIGAFESVGDDGAPPILAPVTAVLTVQKGGTGVGIVTGVGISCGSDCSHVASVGASITLTATPQAGSVFSGWSGGGCSGTGTCSVSLTSALSVVALFSLQGASPISSDLLLKIDFDTDTFGNSFADRSGRGQIATCQPAYSLNGLMHNQCPASSIGPDGSKAAQFIGKTCVVDSDYIGVVDNAFLKNMQKGTISVWGYYDPTAYVGAQLLDSWSYVPGTWGLGRNWNASGDAWMRTRFAVADTSVTTSGFGPYLFLFPDKGQSRWSLYTITWDGSRVKGYFDGVQIADVPQILNVSTNSFYLALGAFTHYEPRNALDESCSTYYGVPKTEQRIMPNNGFLTGKLDDVRIYNRPLSDEEVVQLYKAAGMSPVSSKFAPGSRVQVLQTLNTRSVPTTAGFASGTHGKGALGVIVAGPIAADGYIWWRVDYDSGQDGWSVEDFLGSSSSPIPPNLPLPTTPSVPESPVPPTPSVPSTPPSGGGGGGVTPASPQPEKPRLTTSVSSGGGGGASVSPSGTVVPPNTIPSVASEARSSDAPVFRFTLPLYRGATGPEVVSLQKILISEKLLSSDAATGLYGLQTMRAVESYQLRYGIVAGGDAATTGFGLVGKQTRTHLNTQIEQRKYDSVFGAKTSSAGSLGEADRIASLQRQIIELQKIVQLLVLQLAQMKLPKSQ